jgi:hypothetical protein
VIVKPFTSCAASAERFVVLLGRLPVSEGDERAVTHGCPAVDFLARVRSRVLAAELALVAT